MEDASDYYSQLVAKLAHIVAEAEFRKLLPAEQWEADRDQAAILAFQKYDGIDWKQYLDTYQDVKDNGIDPCLHFLQFGLEEGRQIFPVVEKMKIKLAENLNFNEKKQILLDLVSRYDRIVIIGYKDVWHTHGYIHKQYTDFFQHMGVKYLWIDNVGDYVQLLTDKSLVLFPDKCPLDAAILLRNMHPDSSYIFHDGRQIPDKTLRQIRHIKLFDHRNYYYEYLSQNSQVEKLNEFIYAFPKMKSLLQPWGSPLCEDQFLPPITARNSKEIYFVGSVWGDKDSLIEGNRKIMTSLALELDEAGFPLSVKNRISTPEEIDFLRKSYIAIAPGSTDHCKSEYLQCRIFKNISYGRFTFTDVTPFKKILKDAFHEIDNFTEALNYIKGTPKTKELELCDIQQAYIKDYTYLDMWINMLSCLKKWNQ